jgi:hypothetical protein
MAGTDTRYRRPIRLRRAVAHVARSAALAQKPLDQWPAQSAVSKRSARIQRFRCAMKRRCCSAPLTV